MEEFRKDYFLNRYALISSKRSKRPHFIKHHQKEIDKSCYFCKGNEKQTPKELYVYPEKDNWEIRVFHNKFPAVTSRNNTIMKKKGMLVSYGSFGYHEVIVESPKHRQGLWDLSQGKIKNVLDVYNNRIKENEKKSIKYVSLFKNHGLMAGASVKHSHTQLIAYSHIPSTIKEKEDAVSKIKNPYEKLLKSEMKSKRMCFENSNFVSFCPYASRFHYEIVIFPKRHVLKSTELNNDEIISLAEIMKKILTKLKNLGDDYNFYFQNGIKNMRFHIEIMQRSSQIGGFELSTGCFINSISPEDAAKFYRK
ncbi:MAG: galactose-1-phosphate uridylyltransferase [Nanoarchaeota archaeon]